MIPAQTRNEIAVIDPETLKIRGRYSLPGIENPHGISVDPSDNLAFVAGEGNAKLAVVDLANMKILEIQPVGDDPDVLAFDPGLKMLYVSAESGDVRVFRLEGKKLIALGGLSMPQANTVAVDPKTHLVYFPLQNLDGHPRLWIMEPTDFIH
jgi:DNA-binding beta-propeller fold protein YncE